MISRNIRRTAAGAIVAGFLAVSCGGSETSADPGAADAAPDATASDVSDGATPEILQFTNALVGGGELDASTLAGKPTAFWFWAPN